MLLKDDFGGLGPAKWLRQLTIADPDEAVNLIAKLRDVGEHSPIQGATLQLREPALYSIEPTGTSRCEVKLETRVLLKPTLHLRSLVGAA